VSTDYCERTVYIESADTSRIAEQIVQLFGHEGMLPVPRPSPRRSAYHAAMLLDGAQHNTWGVAVFPGASGWSVIKTAPLNLLAEKSPRSGHMRLLDLCSALNAPGFLLDVYDAGNGRVLAETDGQGRISLSGRSWHDDDIDDADDLLPSNLSESKINDFYGTPIERLPGELRADEEAATKLRFKLLNQLQPLIDFSRSPQCQIPAESTDVRICHYLAKELGGSNARFCGDWESLQPLRLFNPFPANGATILYFSWPPKNRAEPQPTPRERAHIALWESWPFRYQDGTEIREGDKVLWKPDQKYGTVLSFGTVNDAKGQPQAKMGIRTMGGQWLSLTPEMVGDQLHLIARK
jgi:hypothetical protein